MSNTSDHVQAMGRLFREGMRNMSGNATNLVMNVTDRMIRGDRDQAIGEMRRILLASGRVFLHGGSVVFEQRSERYGNRLVMLMADDRLIPSAPSHVSNLLHCAVAGEDDLTTFQVPPKILSEVLNNEATRNELPHISYYGRRPVFNLNFELRNPGYWPEDGLLIHGKAIEPIRWTPGPAARAIDRFPPGLSRVFQDFCLASDADLVNALSILLTGILVNHWVEDGKPMFIFDGNQKGLGKTLMATILSLILDGIMPRPILHTDDEDEMAKRLGARIKAGSAETVLFFDNRKGTIGGELIESMALAPKVTVRRLGKNEDITHDNDFLWIHTANNARATPDSTSRAVIIKFYFEGDPVARLAADRSEKALKDYVRQNRAQILGELFGMVTRWIDSERPMAPSRHRLTRWSEMIGGILQIAGMPEFLTNQDEATLEIDEELQNLIALAEQVVATCQQGFISDEPVVEASFGRVAREWLPSLRTAGVLQQRLTGSHGEREQAIAAGKFLAARLNRPVPIQVEERTGWATLRANNCRSRQKRYWFEISWQCGSTDGDPGLVAGTSPPSTNAAPTNDSSGGPSAEGPTNTSAFDLVATSGNAVSPSPATTTLPSSASAGRGNDLGWEE